MLKVNFYVSILALGLLSACSSMSNIEDAETSTSHFDSTVFGGDFVYQNPKETKGPKYRIFHQASSGFVSVATIKRSAEKRADQYCQDLIGPNGKSLIVSEQNTSSLSLMPGNFPKVELIFSCIQSKAKGHKSEVKVASDSKYQNLRELKSLLDDGVITKNEYDAEKAKVLAN